MNPGFNIFRGQADAGIGEVPRPRSANGEAPRSVGEQYLYCDGELWNESFTDEARLWLTFGERGGDRRAVGDSLQGWTAAPIGQYYLTALLRPFGLYTDRLAYFSHGRAWPLTDFRDGFDPGALLGRTNAFSAPWRDQAPVFGDPTTLPRMVWADLLEAETAAAASLLSALLQAMSTGTAVVWLAPLADFVASSPVHGLVSFARAALPYRMKQHCRLRVYATNPERFLTNGGAQLIVCPEDLRLEAQSAPGKQVVLDRYGRVMAGAIEPNYQGYANHVVTRAQKFPDALFSFSVRADTLSRVDATTIAYDLAYAAEAGRTDQLLLSLYRLASARDNAFPWSALIWESDWKRCNPATLKSLAFEKAPTSDARDLRACIRNALGRIHQQRVDATEALAYLKHLDEGQCAPEIAELKRSGIVDEETARDLSRKTISPAQLLEILKQPEGVGHVASLSDGEVWEPWILETYDKIALPQLWELAQQRAGWIPALVLRMRLEVRNPNYTVQNASAVAEYCGRSVELQDWVVGAELLRRSQLPNDALVNKVWGVRDAKDRWRAMDLAEDKWAICLGDSKGPPADWDADVGARLMENSKIVAGLPCDRLAHLAAQTTAWKSHVTERLSWFMLNDLDSTSKILQRNGIWLKWRLTAPIQVELRQLGWSWMMAAGQQRKEVEPRLEEWEQALLDIGQIQAGDLANWNTLAVTWPSVRLLWPTQLQGLIGRCVRDPGVFCELAMSMGKDYFKSVGECATLDPEWLRVLSHESKADPLPIGSAQRLYEATTHRKQFARHEFVRSVEQALASSEHALDVVIQVVQYRLWPEIAGRLTDLLSRKALPDSVAHSLGRELLTDQSPLHNPEWAVLYKPIVEMLGLDATHKPLVDTLVASVLDGHENGWDILKGIPDPQRIAVFAEVAKSLRHVSPWDEDRKNLAVRVFRFAASNCGLSLREIAELSRSILQGFSRSEMCILTWCDRPKAERSNAVQNWQIILDCLKSAGRDRLEDSLNRIYRYLADCGDKAEVRAFERVARHYSQESYPWIFE